jgi:6-pyruvoyl-tetrahydropterin synthase
MDSYTLDNAQMLLDFGILKTTCKQVIKLFDGSGVLWDKDAKGFKDFFKYRMWSEIIEVPFNPTAEQLSKFFAIVFYMFLTSKIKYANNERIDKDIDVTVKVHETDTGYAQYTAGSEPYTFKKYDEYVKHLKFYNKMEDAQYLFDLEQIKLEEPNQQVKG